MTAKHKRPNQPDFLQTEMDFAAWIRDPEAHELPQNCPEPRMQVYRDLFYSNLEGLVSGVFPVLKSTMTEEAWHALFQDFFANHRCETPYFREVAEEFFGWLMGQQNHPLLADKPWATQLAHYEWVELVLETSEDPLVPDGVDINGDVTQNQPVLSPLALPLAYAWPVHKMTATHIPEAQQTFLIAHRDAEDHVRFLELSAIVAHSLNMVAQKQPVTADALAAAHLTPEQIGQAHQGLRDLHQRGVIAGTQK